MSHAVLIVDGQTLLDHQLDQWHQPPPQFADLIKPGSSQQPWMTAAMTVLAQYLIKDQPITVTVTTHPTGWHMHVQ